MGTPAPVTERYTEPTLRWQPPVDTRDVHRRLADHGELLASYPPGRYDRGPTDCFSLDGEYWMWQPGLGGIQFTPDALEFAAFRGGDVDSAWFEDLIARTWLPAVYPIWDRQVLHASAVVHETNGAVVAFVGPSGAGKSTIAYALAERPEWRQLCDDTLAFSCRGSAIVLHPLRNIARLRSPAAAYFGRADVPAQPIVWPASRMTVEVAYWLDHEAGGSGVLTVDQLGASTSYVRLLEQAHAFTLDVPRHTRRLMRDYLTFAARVPLFRLRYPRSFETLSTVLDGLEAKLRTQLQLGSEGVINGYDDASRARRSSA